MSSVKIAGLGAAQGRNQLVGILLSVGAIFLFCLMDMQVKYLGQSLSVPQIIWARYATLFIIMVVMFFPKRRWGLFRTSHLGLQLTRSLLLLYCTVVFFLAVQYMPLADAVSISFLSPLLVTALSAPLLGEIVGRHRWTAVVIGFMGAMIIVRPDLGVMHWAAWLLVSLSFGYALYQITTRMIAGKDDAVTSLFFTAAVGAGLATLVAPFFWQTPPTPQHWLMLGSLGVIGGLGHYALIKAFEYAPVAVLAPLSYTALPWNTLFGYWLFDDLPDRWTLGGASILIATGIYILYREGIRRNE